MPRVLRQFLAILVASSIVFPVGAATLCWGSNLDKQIDVPSNLDPVVQLVSNSRHTCAIVESGDLACWGLDTNSQSAPTNNGKAWTAVATGLDHSCGVQDGLVTCWGSNKEGQSTPPGGLTTVVALSAGGWHTCALRQDGVVECWGQDSETNDYSTYVPKSISGITKIASGGSHTCAVDNVGALQCWGQNYEKEITVPGDLGVVVALGLGDAHTCVVEQGGNLRCWGRNDNFQSDVPKNLVVESVAAGGSHTCALLQGGSVQCWGDSKDNRLNVPATGNPFSLLAAGLDHTCGVELILTTTTTSSTSLSSTTTISRTTTISSTTSATSSTATTQTVSTSSLSTSTSFTMTGTDTTTTTLASAAETTNPGATATSAKEIEALLELIEAQKSKLSFDQDNQTRAVVPLPGGGEVVASTLTFPVQNGYVQVPIDAATQVWLPLSMFDGLNVTKDDSVLIVSPFTATKLDALGSKPPPGQSGETIEVRAAATIDLHRLVNSLVAGVVEVSSISEPIIFELAANYEGDMTCEYWDTSLLAWSQDNVKVSRSTLGARVVCETWHLSLFGAIVRGFIDTLRCANFDLLQSEAIEQVFKGTWYRGLASIIWFCLLFALVVCFVTGAFLDKRYRKRTNWSDEFFLIPVRSEETGELAVPPEFAEKASAVSQRSSASAGEAPTQRSAWSARRTFKGVCAACAVVSKMWNWLKESSAMKEALDDIVGSWFEHFADLRAYFEGLCQGVEAECEGCTHGQCCVGGQLFLTRILLLCSRRLAGSIMGISDSMVVYIMEDEDLCEFLMMEHNQKAQQGALMKNSPNRSNNLHADPAEGGDSPTTPTASSAGAGTGLQTPTEGALQPSSLLPMSLPPQSQSISRSEGSSPGDWRRSTEQRQAWVLLHDEVSNTLLDHADTKHGLLKAVSSLFIVHTPLGSSFIFDIFVSCKERILLLAVELVGSFCLASVFFQSTGFVNGNHPSCDGESGGSTSADAEIGSRIGRVIAIATVSLFLAVLPALLLGSLQTKGLKWMDYRGSQAWNRQLLAWKIQTRIVYAVALLYIGFCVFYVTVFLANLNDNDQENYCMSCATGLCHPPLCALSDDSYDGKGGSLLARPTQQWTQGQNCAQGERAPA